MAFKAEHATKEVTSKYKSAKVELGALTKTCIQRTAQHAVAAKTVQSSLEKVKHAVFSAKKICDADKKAKEKAAKEKKLLKVHGETFRFKSEPCKAGHGTFTKKLLLRQRVNIGVVPSNMFNVKVSLKTESDVDAELWTKDSELAVVAWKCKKHNALRKPSIFSKACIDSDIKQQRKYGKMLLKYSGYMGIQDQYGHKLGHEYIHIHGRSSMPFMMKAFAYEAGVARVKYSWEVDPKSCKAHRAMQKKEQTAKSAAKVAIKKAMSEKDSKRVQQLIVVKNASCADANKKAQAAAAAVKQAREGKSNAQKEVTACRVQKAKQLGVVNTISRTMAALKAATAKVHAQEAVAKRRVAMLRTRMLSKTKAKHNADGVAKVAMEHAQKAENLVKGNRKRTIAAKVEKNMKEKVAKRKSAIEATTKAERAGKEATNKYANAFCRGSSNRAKHGGFGRNENL
jgi:hypothetical protein